MREEVIFMDRKGVVITRDEDGGTSLYGLEVETSEDGAQLKLVFHGRRRRNAE